MNVLRMSVVIMEPVTTTQEVTCVNAIKDTTLYQMQLLFAKVCLQ